MQDAAGAGVVADYRISMTEQQNQYSQSYIMAITSIAGYSLEEIRVDQDSVDATVTQRGDKDSNGDRYPFCERLHIQLKCTYHHWPKSDGQIHFPLQKKNYNDLRRIKITVPRILVVLYTPRDLDGCLSNLTDSMLLNHSAHWVCLKGYDPLPEDQDSVTVYVPMNQRFTVDWLRTTMNCMAYANTLEQLDQCLGVTI